MHNVQLMKRSTFETGPRIIIVQDKTNQKDGSRCCSLRVGQGYLTFKGVVEISHGYHEILITSLLP